MFKLLTLEKKEDFFKPLAARSGNGVFFCRFIGFDDETMLFYRKFQQAAQIRGAYIRSGMQNPLDTHVTAFAQAVDLNGFRMEQSYLNSAVNAWLTQATPTQQKLLGEALWEKLGTLQSSGTNLNILKNAFVKFMCWARYIFADTICAIDGNEAPKVLFEGDISKYELYMLRILSCAGCDILYIHFTDERSYLQYDPASAYSRPVYCKRRGEPPKHFTTIDLARIEKAREIKQQAEASKELVNTNKWMTAGIMDDLFKSVAGRGPSPELYYNLFGRYLGHGGRDQYLAEIYRFRLRLTESGRPLVFQDKTIPNPTLDEVKALRPFQYQRREELLAQLAQRVEVPGGDRELTAILQAAVLQALQRDGDETLPKLYNHGMKLLCWLRRYSEKLYQGLQRHNLPVFVYYGKCNDSEAEFLNLLSATPVDVVLLCPDKTVESAFASLGEQDRGVREELEQTSAEVFPFPQTEPRLQAATAAYSAQQELDNILYSDTGLFRHKQFTRCNPITLKTTYDEIGIYWRKEAKYRPNFETGGGRVVVPNVFAKVCGVKDGDAAQYFRTIEGMLTPKTLLINRIPFITPQTPNPIKPNVHKFWKDGAILPDIIKADPQYQYDYHSDSLQDFILEKIQLMIEWKLIEANTMGLEYAILSTLLNIDRKTLRLIQEFDFVGEIPKVVVISTSESMLSLEDCIYLTFCNMVGFDIVIFTPTGYRNIEKHVRREAFEEYQIGKYLFNLATPHMQVPSENNSGGLLTRILGKGR